MSKKKKKKKQGKLIVIVVIILVVAIVAAGVVLYLTRPDTFNGVVERVRAIVVSVAKERASSGNGEGTRTNTDVQAGTGDVVLEEGDLSFHFMTLGNKFTGDSTYVKIGDVDILIDAGSRADSADDITRYVNGYCTDGKLEYVIATHAHQDHIAGFTGSSSVLKAFRIGTIIEFARTNATGSTYTNYCAERDAAVSRGAKAYTALQCWNNANGAQRTYTLAPGVTMDVLYNYYYEHDDDDENNYSVCVMFNYGDNHYLFTGDLEKDGESYLVDNNTLPHCALFKGGHHGSYTANTAKLMDVIRPDVVCVCCCCGTPEYTTNNRRTFPSQDFFDHVLPYTDQIFVTSMVADFENEEDVFAGKKVSPKYGFTDMNGNIAVVVHNGKMTVTCSVSATPVPYTDWFAKHRVWPDGYGPNK